jgi:hypothetical protein
MRRKFTWLATVFGGLIAAAAGAAEPATLPDPAAPLILTNPGVQVPAGTTGQAPTIIMQGPVTFINGTPADAVPAQRHRLGARVVKPVYHTAAASVHVAAWPVRRGVELLKSPEHNCEPDGCPTPVGCSNPWTEFKFVFGSCTQFFGSGDATRGCCHGTTVPPRQPGSPHP